MRFIGSTITVLTFASAVGISAQQQAPPAPPAPPPAQSLAAEQAPKLTLTGCVLQAKTTDGGTAYVLNKVEGAPATMYVLGGSTQSDWTANVNKRVEVSGAVQEPPTANKESAADPKVLRPPMVVVESVRVVSQTCS